MTAPSADGATPPDTLSSGATATANVTMLAAAAIVVADMVGVGCFTSLGFQLRDVTSGFALMMLWAVGGVVAICGAFAYAELASMFPRSSGEYNFLSRAYHPALGFLAGALSATVGFSAPVALAAMAFGAYAKGLAPQASPLLLGLGLIWVVSAIHLGGTRHGSRFQLASTVLKLALLAAFIVVGFAVGGGRAPSFAPSAVAASQILSAPFAISLVFVMYSYSGWNAATYILSEIKDPQRNLPKALFIGTGIVTLLYLSLNAVFLYSTPVSELSGKLDVALIAGTHIFGAGGGRVVGALICIGLVSSVSAMMWIGPRVASTMGEDIGLLRIFAQRSEDGVPTAAILFQAVVSSVLLCTQSFEAVLDFIQFSLTFCSFLTVLAVIKLRITRPDLPRPYRAWGYPFTPLIFLAVSAFIMYYLITVRPIQSLAGFLVMLAGLLLYGFLTTQQAAMQRAIPK